MYKQETFKRADLGPIVHTGEAQDRGHCQEEGPADAEAQDMWREGPAVPGHGVGVALLAP